MNNNNKTIRGKTVSSQERAYLAGLLDGEGCINIYKIDTKATYKGGQRKKYPRYELSVTIYNTHHETMLWLHKEFGGYLQTRYKNKKPTPAINGTWKTSYAWKLSSNQAKDFLLMVEKYMRIKKDQTRTAIEFQVKRSKKRHRMKPITYKENKFFNRCWLKMKKLNAQGEKNIQLPAETKRKDTPKGVKR